MPAVLKEMMRHSSINTTMQFYAVGTAESTAATLWEAHRTAAKFTDTFTDTAEKSPKLMAKNKAANT
jgi:hypothetical protein